MTDVGRKENRYEQLSAFPRSWSSSNENLGVLGVI